MLTKSTARQVAEDKLLLILLLLLLVVVAATRKSLKFYLSLIDWNAVSSIALLILTTRGMRDSGFFEYVVSKLIRNVKTQRGIVSMLIVASTLLSPLLMNDTTILIIVPLTLTLASRTDISKDEVVSLEIIAINVGSSLLPIGNPQNIIIWHYFSIDTLHFFAYMLPCVAASILILLLYILLLFEDKGVSVKICPSEKFDKALLAASSLLLVATVILSEEDVPYLLIPFAIAVYFILCRETLRNFDWRLLLVFILMYIDFRAVTQISIISGTLSKVKSLCPFCTYLAALLLSQVVSNVPATLMLINHASSWVPLTYGVNLGGNGFLIGSLANIIAFRLAKIDLKTFHKLSLTYLLLSAIAGLTLLYVLDLSYL